MLCCRLVEGLCCLQRAFEDGRVPMSKFISTYGAADQSQSTVKYEGFKGLEHQ